MWLFIKKIKKRKTEEKRKNDLFSLERHHTFPSWFHDECRERHDIVCAGLRWEMNDFIILESRENEVKKTRFSWIQENRKSLNFPGSSSEGLSILNTSRSLACRQKIAVTRNSSEDLHAKNWSASLVINVENSTIMLIINFMMFIYLRRTKSFFFNVAKNRCLICTENSTFLRLLLRNFTIFRRFFVVNFNSLFGPTQGS